MELLPRLHLIPGAGNAYLWLGETRLTLIDTGMPGRLEPLFDRLWQLGRRPEELAHIVITHADLDHAGKAAALHAATGARIHASAPTAVLLRDGRSAQHMPRPVQFVLDRFLKIPPVPADAIHLCHDGDELPIMGGLQVLATPGHTLDHHSFYSPSLGLLIAGDALNTRRGRLNLTPPAITADPAAAVESGLRLLSLAPGIIACGHGRPSTDHTMAELMALGAELRRRQPV